MLWNRQLHQQAVYLRIGIQRGDLRKQRCFAGVGGQGDMLGMQTQFGTGFHLVGDIYFGGRVFADDDDCQSGRDAAGFEGICAHFPFGAHFLRDRFAVNNACGHISLLKSGSMCGVWWIRTAV